MRIPVLIFVISAMAAGHFYPKAVKYVAHRDTVSAISTQLADTQMDMLCALRSAHDSVEALQKHEEGLKYAIRAEQIRLAQCKQNSKLHC